MSQVVVRAAVSHFPATRIATADLIRRERPHHVFSLRERRGMGAKSIHVISPDEKPSDLAILAAQKALVQANLRAADLDLIVSASCTPADYDMWSMPAKIAEQIGATDAECLGVGDAGCAAAFAALRLVVPTMRAPGGPRRVLIFNVSVTLGSHFIPPYTTYGDGAGAIILERTSSRNKGARIVRADFRSYPKFIRAFRCDAGVIRLRAAGTLVPDDWTMRPVDDEKMRELADECCDLCVLSINESLKKAGWKQSDVRWLLTDNVGRAAIEDIAHGLGISEERTLFQNCTRYGHAWVVDLFANLETVLYEKEVAAGDRIVCTGAGLGEHFGVLLLEV